MYTLFLSVKRLGILKSVLIQEVSKKANNFNILQWSLNWLTFRNILNSTSGLGGHMTLSFNNKALSKVVLSLLILSLFGCGGFESNNNSTNPGGGGGLGDPINPDPDDTDEPISYEDGAGVYLRNMHPEIASSFSKVYFHADLGDVAGTPGTASMRQGGSVILTFEGSNGQKINRYFSTGGSTYATLGNNYWSKKPSGEYMWQGIFQGEFGALIVIVDGVFTYGDGLGPDDTMSGSVWFRRWQVISDNLLTHECRMNSQGLWDCKNQSAPLTQCWYVSLGPYDCRFQISSDGKLVTRKPNPTNDTDWVKLGEFTDLNKSKTFHETY